MTTRRELLIALGLGTSWPSAVLAQAKPPVVIGWLAAGSSAVSRQLPALKEGMAELGWKEGVSYTLEERWAQGRATRLPSLAAELAAKRSAVIVTSLDGATRAAAEAAPNTPIVQAQGGSPVEAGLAKSLARPGGMVTGVTNIVDEVSTKYLALLLDAAPKLTRIGFLVDSSTTRYRNHIKTAQSGVEKYRVESSFAVMASVDDLGPAIERLAKDGVQGVVVLPGTWFAAERRRIMKLALEQRWPVIAGPVGFAEEGALLSYSADASALARRAAYYVDRILKSAKPGDLPIEQPTKFRLVLNMKTAKRLGLMIPPQVLVQADRVIE